MYAHVIGKKSALLSQHLQRQINPDILKGAQFLESSESSGKAVGQTLRSTQFLESSGTDTLKQSRESSGTDTSGSIALD
ncbi:MAG: hypothetical protein ACI87H_001767 [Gammaproteobacteria bacterium]|jgi:hypothetical protein